MKNGWVLVFLASAAFAQNEAAVARARSACGPADVQFEVQTGAGRPFPGPDANQALVYIIEVFTGPPNELANPTVRIGLDGVWIGATKGGSYLALYAAAGERHLCTQWQSRFKRFSSMVALAGLTAEPGKTYYLRARLTDAQGFFTLDLDPLNGDEGKLLVASSALSTSQPKDPHKTP